MKKNLIVWATLILLVGIGIFTWMPSEKPYKDDTEANFHLYKDDREQIIRKLVSGEIAKEPDRYGNEGFYFYLPLSVNSHYSFFHLGDSLFIN